MPQRLIEAERSIDFLFGKCLGDGWIGEDPVTVVAALVPCVHRVSLHQRVGGFARQALLGEFQQQSPAESEPAGQIEVRAHLLLVDDERLHQTREAVQHEVESRRGVGKDDSLDGGVADVALVPERPVLQCGTA